MLRGKSKTQFVKQESNTQNASAFLNYLKRIVPQQLMLRKQVFTKNVQSAKNASPTFLSKKVTSYMTFEVHRI
jgi:hypothetical protein